MKIKIYSVRDVASECYTQPTFLQAHGQAIRTFSDAVNNKEHPFGQHPDHYTLFHIGLYDDQNAKVTAVTPQSLGNGVEFLTSSNQPDLFKGNSNDEIHSEPPIQPD